MLSEGDQLGAGTGTLCLPYSCVILSCTCTCTSSLSFFTVFCLDQGLIATAEFSQNGVNGTITFSQDNEHAPTVIQVNVLGLDSSQSFPWHVHQYPFLLSSPSPCSDSSVGGHYDPLGASSAANYTALCTSNSSLCEVGDLSGKFGDLEGPNSSLSRTDNSISLFGIYSIIGRSVVIHRQDGSRFVCANIGYPPDSLNSSSTIFYSPFRASVSGNIYVRQYRESMTSVYVNTLLLSGDTVPSLGHSWHVHENPIQANDSTCMSAGGHYNPRAVDTSSANYSQNCGPLNPLQCEVGDLSSKGGPIHFSEERGRLLYTDTDLPISPTAEDLSIANLSLVVHQANGSGSRLSCANLTQLLGREAAAVFSEEDGVSGTITFSQRTPFDPTTVMIDLKNLSFRAGGYHVHDTPIGAGDDKCSEQFTGGHWNPHNVTDPVINGTNDQYEVGDLSGKFGSLSMVNDTCMTFVDQNLPLFGANSVIGRSVVIHLQGDNSPWICANIVPVGAVVEASAAFSVGGQILRIVFQQPADDPYADTTIFVSTIITPQPPSTTTSLLPSLSVTSIAPLQTQMATTEHSVMPLSPYPFQSLGSSTFVSPTVVATTTPLEGSGQSVAMGKRDVDEDLDLFSEELVMPLDVEIEEEGVLEETGRAVALIHRIKRMEQLPSSIDWSVRLAPLTSPPLTDCEMLKVLASDKERFVLHAQSSSC